jgi:hypothetical protein
LTFFWKIYILYINSPQCTKKLLYNLYGLSAKYNSTGSNIYTLYIYIWCFTLNGSWNFKEDRYIEASDTYSFGIIIYEVISGLPTLHIVYLLITIAEIPIVLYNFIHNKSQKIFFDRMTCTFC